MVASGFLIHRLIYLLEAKNINHNGCFKKTKEGYGEHQHKACPCHEEWKIYPWLQINIEDTQTGESKACHHCYQYTTTQVDWDMNFSSLCFPPEQLFILLNITIVLWNYWTLFIPVYSCLFLFIPVYSCLLAPLTKVWFLNLSFMDSSTNMS